MRKTLFTLAASVAAVAVTSPLFAQDHFDIQVNDSPRAVVIQAIGSAELMLQPSTHWLGVNVRPADETLCAQLKIKHGLVVEHVSTDSPAAKAGVEQHDILLSIDKQKLASPEVLVELMNKGKDAEVEVQLLHAGEKKSLKLKPVKRPADHLTFSTARPLVVDATGAVKDTKEFEIRLREMAKDPEKFRELVPPGAMPLRAKFFHPGIVMEAGTVSVSALPDGLQISITKTGDEPAKIKVQRDEEKWEITDKELDTLPEDVRKHVKSFLQGPTTAGVRLEGAKFFAPAAPAVPAVREGSVEIRRIEPAMPMHVQAHAFRVAEPEFEKRIGEKFDAMMQKLEKIEKRLDQMSQDKE